MENKPKKNQGILSYFIFWGYNFIFIASVGLLLLNIAFYSRGHIPSLKELLTFGGMQTDILTAIYTIILTPFISSILVLFTKLKRQPLNLAKLFFGFEIPLMGIAFIRFIFFRQLTPVIWVFFLSIIISIIGLLFYLFKPEIKSKLKLTLLMLSQQIALLVSGYGFLLIFFFLPILLAFFLKSLYFMGLWSMLNSLTYAFTHQGILVFLFYLFMLILALLTFAFFIIGPIGAFITFWKTCKNYYQKLIDEYGLNYARKIRYGVSAVFILAIILLSIQNRNDNLLNLLSDYKSTQTFEDGQKVAKQIVSRQKELRNYLVSTYLARYRYLSDNSMNILQQGYKNELTVDGNTAGIIQQLFNKIALPFVYNGVFEEEIKKSSEDYMQLFDNPIQRGETDTIAKALKEANTNDSLKAGILDLNKKTVRLVSRNTNISPSYNGLLATVTVEEEYENTSRSLQEVYYEFSLTDSSVITDLKLGPDLELSPSAADKPQSINPPQNQNTPPAAKTQKTPEKKIDTAVIAPKGAAQNTFDNQIFRRMDPALIAQVGPRQYKLRVFPIPVKPDNNRNAVTVTRVKNQKVRYTYVTFASIEGISLPTISEQRNIFTDKNSKISYYYNGQAVNAQDNIIKKNNTSCLDSILETKTTVGTIAYIAHSINPDLSSQYSCDKGFNNVAKNIKGLKVALLLDSSFSNKQTNWNSYLKQDFPIDDLITQNSVDLYFFNDKLSQKIMLKKDNFDSALNVFSIGKTDRLGALNSLNEHYDLILMVTDDNVSDSKTSHTAVSMNVPVFIIQPGNKIPPYNDTLTNLVIQNGGAVVANGYQALENFWQQTQFKELKSLGTILKTDQFGTWVLLKDNIMFAKNIKVQQIDPLDPFTKLAKKMVILESIKGLKGETSNLASLDKINQLSKEDFIVTPFSSMIVLLDENQKNQLAAAQKQDNRYQVNLDYGEETIANPSGSRLLAIGATPEPHEWALIGICCILLVYLYRRNAKLIFVSFYENFKNPKKY